METTGRSVQEAKDAALDELGVDEADAEFEIIAEAQTGLFGRLRSEARVRARVRPTTPRAKEDRRGRERRRRSGAQGKETPGTDGEPRRDGESDTASSPARNGARAGSPVPAGGAGAEPGSSPSPTGGRGATTVTGPAPETGIAEAAAGEASDRADGGDAPDEAPEGRDASGQGPRRNRRRRGKRPGEAPSQQERASAEQAGGDEDRSAKGPEVDVDLDQQAEVAADFLTKLAAEFGVDATVTVARPDDDTVEIQLTGPDLGILIGPKGATLVAIQNLTRTVVFNETGGSNGHINVDVAGYRHKRTEALVRFSHQVAEQVKSSGKRTALEPMSAVDRKVVHDTIAGIEGVSTISEGEEPRRRVVVLPG